MPVVETPFSWSEVAIAFAVLSLAAFLVTWVITDVLEIGRTWYVAILAVTAAGLSAAYLAWTDGSATELVTSNVARGVLAGVLAAAVVSRSSGGCPRGDARRVADSGCSWSGRRASTGSPRRCFSRRSPCW